jgi:hypothetical protein
MLGAIAAAALSTALVVTSGGPAPAQAAKLGPLVEDILVELTERFGEEAAKRIVERAIEGEPMPDLKVTESMLKQAALNQVEKCVARANAIDGRVRSGEAAQPGISSDKASELKAFHESCDAVLNGK